MKAQTQHCVCARVRVLAYGGVVGGFYKKQEKFELAVTGWKKSREDIPKSKKHRRLKTDGDETQKS